MAAAQRAQEQGADALAVMRERWQAAQASAAQGRDADAAAVLAWP